MNSILQGTTPILTITINPDDLLLSNITDLELTFRQMGDPIYKKQADCVIDYEGNTVSYHFSEKETLELMHTRSLNWQIRFLMPDGNIVGTKINQIKVSDLMSEKEMSK